MKHLTPEVNLLRLLAGIILAVIVMVPFHALLTVWAASGVGHYTWLRLWKARLLGLLKTPKLRRQLQASLLVRLSCLYIAVIILWALVAYAFHAVTLKAAAYGVLSDTRLLVFFLAVLVVASLTPILHKRWRAAVVIPAMIVIIIGLLQYFVLPYDVLKHFGYNQNTIYPYEDINHNINYMRVMSTLRGANPLGAYLLLVISLLLALWARTKKQWQLAILPAAALLVLVLTFSRGAWIGMVVATATVIFVSFKSARWRRPSLLAAVGLVVVAGISLAVLRHNTAFQNAFFHTDEHSTIATSSNEGHSSALKSGLKDLALHPLGHGPGSAGPASVYNGPRAPRIAENYFIQIGQEAGWLGFVLFIAINVFLGRELWLRRDQPLALGLFAALIGLSIVNLLSHAWTDDTLAYLFWGLAGIALAAGDTPKQKARKRV
jgi:hypothetical protein